MCEFLCVSIRSPVSYQFILSSRSGRSAPRATNFVFCRSRARSPPNKSRPVCVCTYWRSHTVNVDSRNRIYSVQKIATGKGDIHLFILIYVSHTIAVVIVNFVLVARVSRARLCSLCCDLSLFFVWFVLVLDVYRVGQIDRCSVFLLQPTTCVFCTTFNSTRIAYRLLGKRHEAQASWSACIAMR